MSPAPASTLRIPLKLYILQMHPAQPDIHDRMLHPTMDAAGLVHLMTCLSTQARPLGDKKRCLQEVAAQVQQLSTSLSQLVVQLPATTRHRISTTHHHPS